MDFYAPLKLLQNNKRMTFKDIKRLCCNLRVKNADKLTVDHYLDTMLCDYDNDTPLSNALTKITVDIIKNSKVVGEKTDLHNFAEVSDIVVFPVILEEWEKAKQVFKPDAIFADALLHTEKLCITRDMIHHLPYNCFYIDLTGCEKFNPMEGIFVYIREFEGVIHCVLYAISHNLAFFSMYLPLQFDENGVATNIDYNDVFMSKIPSYDTLFIPNYVAESEEEYQKYKNALDDKELQSAEISRGELYAFAYQMIAYLSIDEPQLTESELTVHTYKGYSNRIRNKWSEVRIQDVGVRYGTEFRKKYLSSDYTPSEDEGGKRKSPIPHFRSAHWQRYRVGKGRTGILVKWIAPTFVGNGEAKDVVIHKVKEEKDKDATS